MRVIDGVVMLEDPDELHDDSIVKPLYFLGKVENREATGGYEYYLFKNKKLIDEILDFDEALEKIKKFLADEVSNG